MPLLRYFADDPDFYGLLDHFFERIAAHYAPRDLFLIRIDNWFDFKWLGFAGTTPLNTMALLGNSNLPIATRGVWSSYEETKVPPFTPSRIVSQQHFHCDDGSLRRPANPINVHPPEEHRTAPKTEPRILDFSEHGHFFWISSDSASSGRGSLMSYFTVDGGVGSWYASLERLRSGRWIVSRSKNMDREVLANFLNLYYEDPTISPRRKDAMPMQTWVALFRGINVGGRNLLPMAKLRSELESLGLTDVHTYIQSGNVVFNTTATETSFLAESITARIEEQHGFRPHLMMLSHQDLLTAVESNPFPEAVTEPKTLHFTFLAEPATAPDLEALAKAKAATERYKLIDRVFYLHAPKGIGRSKLAANVEKYLGVVTTARNYRTVAKLLSMATPT